MVNKMAKHRSEAPPVYAVERHEHRWLILRNGRVFMSPAGRPYAFPQETLALAVMAEWQAQGEKIIPAQMPLTQLAATALDVVGRDRAKTIGGLSAYVGTELLCYRTEATDSLSHKQQELWQPYLDWCEDRFAVHFVIGCGVMPIAQKPETLTRLVAHIESYDDYILAGLSSATDSAGSLVLGLALAEGFGRAEAVFAACELDVTHQAIRWGEDPVTQNRHATIRRDLEACERWFDLLRAA